MATVRAVWTAVEGADGEEQIKLKREINQTVNRLKSRVEGRLGRPVATVAREPQLFDEPDDQQAPEAEVAAPQQPPRFAEPVFRVYAKDFADHAFQHLPQAVNAPSLA